MTMRTRREPPPFRRAVVRRVVDLSSWMRRITLAGPELGRMSLDLPAASVRLLIPEGDGTLVLPTWTGNQFLTDDGRRPLIRTLTPRRHDGGSEELDVDVVVHDGGAASDWAVRGEIGSHAAVSGFGRGYAIDYATERYLLVGDETAIPAMSQLLESVPHSISVRAHVEVAHADARQHLPDHPAAVVEWHDRRAGEQPGERLVGVMHDVELDAHTRLWAAGEAAAMQRIRVRLFKERAVPRDQATIRGYWKHGRASTDA